MRNGRGFVVGLVVTSLACYMRHTQKVVLLAPCVNPYLLSSMASCFLFHNFALLQPPSLLSLLRPSFFCVPVATYLGSSLS